MLPGHQEKLPNDNDTRPKMKHGRRIRIENLANWVTEHQLVNVHRDFNLYSKGVGECDTLEGPILFDIDKGEKNLVAPCKCAAESLKFLRQNVGVNLLEDCRVLFSGRKGFHIELRPSAIPLHLLEHHGSFGRTLLDLELIKYIRRAFKTRAVNSNQLDHEGTVLDPQALNKRINGSINAWSEDRNIHYRKMVPIEPNRLLLGNPNELVAELMRQSQVMPPEI